MEAQDPIQVETVNLPPQSPPPPETEPQKTEPAPPTQKGEDLIAKKPKPTPTPSAKPSPALAKPSPTPMPTPSPSASELSKPSPSPEASPTPIPSPTANLPEGEAQRKQAVQKYFADQDLEMPEELPPGFKSWEDYEKFLTDGEGFEKKANDMMRLPENTTGSENASGNPSPNSSPASGSPGENTGGREGSRLGFLDRLFGEQDQPQNFDTNATEKDLDSSRDRLRDLAKLDISHLPPPKPATNISSGNLGFEYIRFDHDQLRFQARWDPDVQPELRQTDINYYPPNDPGQIKSFSLKWQPQWEGDQNQLITSVQIQYERLKRNKP